MTSKADYLRKYLGSDDTGDKPKKDKKKKKLKKRANLAIHDDDIDWRSLMPQNQEDVDEEDDPDDAPQVAEFKDESIPQVIKWQPLDSKKPVTKDSDLSPPRRLQGSGGSPDLSPPRAVQRKRRNSEEDLSPPRKRKHTSRTDGRDMSPPRRSRARHDSPQLIESRVSKGKRSPPRRTRHDSVDNSPPRRTRHDSVDNSPPRSRHDSVDNSPPRRTRHDSVDNSPPRSTRHDSVDNSPPRRSGHGSEDLSPPRKTSRGQQSTDLSPPRKSSKVASKDKDRMSSGAKAGLQNAKALKEENALVRKRQEEFFKSLDPSMSGRHAETVYRDKQGKRVDPKLEKLRQREKEREMEEENEKFMKWGRGAAQSKNYEEKLQDDLYEMSKPLARYADDEDLEKMLKERERAGDPMLAFIKKSKPTKTNKKPRKERPTYKGPFPPNRYGIRPGYRWDGVNRSNGFEKAWFARESNKTAVAEEAYMWSVEDM